MRAFCLGCLIFGAGLIPCAAGEGTLDPDEAIRLGRQWLEANVDTNVLDSLGLDLDAVEELARDIQRQFNSEYVLDLAELQDTARAWLPQLEQNEATRPYAAWLRSHTDYFDVARQLKEAAPTNVARWNPTPAQQRAAWQKQLQREPWPLASQNWMPKLKAIFAAQKVPAELAWLAEIESGFDPAARSPVGAVGMFQLMPVTAKRFGLSTGWLADDRKNPTKSALAAAKYLRALYAQFKDWRLTAAAFNAGEGRVLALMKKHKAKTFDALSSFLPAETQMYVPKLEATLLKREGAILSSLKPPAPQPRG